MTVPATAPAKVLAWVNEVARLTRPDRVREWKYEFDPSAFEHLRRSVEHILAARATAGQLVAAIR